MIRLFVVGIATLHAVKCTENMHIVNVDEDFNKIKTDAALSQYVSEILNRLRTFKVPVHPRIRLFYQLLKKGMGEYADQTADTIFVPFKYNDRKAQRAMRSDKQKKS